MVWNLTVAWWLHKEAACCTAVLSSCNAFLRWLYIKTVRKQASFCIFEYEPAVCLHGQGDQEHPGLCQKQCGQQDCVPKSRTIYPVCDTPIHREQKYCLYCMLVQIWVLGVNSTKLAHRLAESEQNQGNYSLYSKSFIMLYIPLKGIFLLCLTRQTCSLVG